MLSHSFNLAMGRSRSFGSTIRYLTPYSDSLSLRLHSNWNLSLQRTVTRQSIMQKVRRQPFLLAETQAFDRLQVYNFRFYFTPLTGVLFNFPSRYQSTFGQTRVFSLSPWSGQIPARFPVPRSTWGTSRVLPNFVYRTFTFFGRLFHAFLLFLSNPILRPRNPSSQRRKFRLFPFRSPLLGESLSVSSPGVTQMFQFTPCSFHEL